MRTKLIFSCALALCWLVAGSTLSSSQEARGLGSIRGAVRIVATGRAVPSATVLVLGTKFGATTDSAGAFVIAAIPPGRYEVEARRIGIAVARQVVTVREGRASQVDFVVTEASTELVGIRVVGAPADALTRFAGSGSVVTARELEIQRPLSANEVLRALPGVHVQEEEGAGLRANIGIRGLDPDRSRTLLVLEDGVPVALAPYGEPELYYSPPIERMERVELIKGSGSILFGPQTIGGILNYVTADAPATPRGRLFAQWGSGASQLQRAHYGGTWNNARATLTAFRRRTGDLGGLAHQAADVTTKFGFRAGRDDFGLKLSVYDESSNATYVGLTDSLFRAAPYRHPAPNDRLRLRRYAVTATHERALGGAGNRAATLRTSAYAYQTSRNWQRQDYTYNATGNSLVFRSSTGNRDREFEVAGVEPRVRALWSAAGINNEIEMGARAHVERARDQFVLGSSGTSRTGAIRDDEIRTGVALAAFVQNRMQITQALHVTPGVRFERFTFERNLLRMPVRRTTPNGTVTRNPEDVDLVSHDRVAEVIPGIGATWAPSERVTAFAGVHRGFAPPRTKDAFVYDDPTLAPNAQVPSPVTLQLDAERSWNYELGSRLQPARFLSLELTAFYLDFSNQIIEPSLSAGSVAQASLANQGQTRHRGVEAGFSLDIGKAFGAPFSLVAGGNHTYVDAAFAGNRFLRRAAGDTVNIRGNALPYAPRSRQSVALQFEHPLGIDVRLAGLFVGRQFADNFETAAAAPNGRVGVIPAYRVYDATARAPLGGSAWPKLIVSVKNLTSATYIASRRPEGIKPGLPRLVSVGAEWAF